MEFVSKIHPCCVFNDAQLPLKSIIEASDSNYKHIA